MNRVVHFEIHPDDIDRASTFYAVVFGWSIRKWKGDFEYSMVMTAEEGSGEPGIDGGIVKRSNKTPQQECGLNAFDCTIQVDDFDEMDNKILKAGGIVEMPKFALAGLAWQGYFIDTEGNTFGIHQPDENAR